MTAQKDRANLVATKAHAHPQIPPHRLHLPRPPCGLRLAWRWGGCVCSRTDLYGGRAHHDGAGQLCSRTGGDEERLLRRLSPGDLRRARAAAENIIPTTTGAARACGIVIPELQGKVHGISLRVPTATVSVTDYVCNVESEVTVDNVNTVLREAAEGYLNGILGYNEEPLVSSDYKQDPHSCIIDGLSTMTMGKNMVKVLGWYDNEWGYSCRTADLCAFLVDKGL